jgi:hypothetical protein
MFRSTAEAIAASQLSIALQNAAWLVPVSQSLHIIALSVVFASTTFINLRLLGLPRDGRSVSQLIDALVPWIWRALLLCLATGLLQTITEPVRQFITPIYWCKLLFIALLSLWTARIARHVRAERAVWDAPATRPVEARVFALVSMAGWLSIVVFGRFIGYVWAYYL